MATLVLAAAGSAIGGAVGGTVLGLSAAALGQAAGAALGQMIDQRLLGGSQAVEAGRIDRLRLTSANEGSVIPQIYGRTRVAGQVIWATRFLEDQTTTGGGKNAPTVTEYSYTVSLAIALCEGEISGIGRIWADGAEIAVDDLAIRVYKGTETQRPDPRIEAVEGQGAAPAYRGTAYVVIEDMPLGRFGNRVPQLSFEVFRPSASGEVADLVNGVALIPGTGEYALATTPVNAQDGLGAYRSLNINSPSGKSDLETSLDALECELPNAKSVSVIVSWFGNDLRCGTCRIGPRAENDQQDPEAMAWTVSGADRTAAGLVPYDGGRAVYGGTPCDASVIEAIRAITARGMSAMFYPFILMEQMAQNTLPDPWGSDTQPALPWRGRITTSLAPDQPGSPDGTRTARDEVDAFFGTAQVSDFALSGDRVTYTGPLEWSYRRFILHYAHLCAIAGGVASFCIGSEMRSLTQIRDNKGFPAVEHLRQLAAEVREILPDAQIGYAADWSEYHGYQPAGTADKLFHLDPLWADANVDFIGIDNYMPLSDWRDGNDHADAAWGAIHNADYLAANIEGGEMYDWFYHSPEARDAQIRTPITDGQNEPWIWRAKDIRNWWLNPHYDRVDGIRSDTPTAWEPQSKPIVFTELGCAAIDKATNQPNKFLDPKSSESSLPHYSNGGRDDLIQTQYLRAMHGHYGQAANNPVSALYNGPMVDMTRAHVWAWDSRPFPHFPANAAVWADGDNYARGHWLNGRAASRTLASVVTEVCARSGVTDVDTSRLYGIVRGYASDALTARAALQPLQLAFGFDVVDRDGKLTFISRTTATGEPLDENLLALPDDAATAVERSRSSEAEVAGRIRLGYVESGGDYQDRSAEAIHADDTTRTASRSELPLVLTAGEAGQIADRWLSEARVAREVLRFALPPSQSHLGAGDTVSLNGISYRIDRITHAGLAEVEAVQISPNIYAPSPATDDVVTMRDFVAPVPVTGLFLDLPVMDGEAPHTPHFAALGVPWPGAVLLWHGEDDEDYTLAQTHYTSAIAGELLDPLPPAGCATWDRGPAVRIKLAKGALSSRKVAGLLSGKNLAAVGDGSTGGWELLQFRKATLVAPDTYAIETRLRGRFGTDDIALYGHEAGSLFVLIDKAVQPVDYPETLRGVARHYRYGPAMRAPDDPAFRHVEVACEGRGLRPYAPCHVRQTDDPNGGHRITWIRRTRLGGDDWAGTDVPLSEEKEEYRVRIWVNGQMTREEVTNAPDWHYESHLMQADSAGAGYDVELAQMSARFGAGAARYLKVA
ncbi:host specificity protein [Marivivens donghaensis]|uniref:Host specificity protein n=1 Tax=Marivivens donghaensis TaxID=1699413 RepID=A0ABX0VY00_9RHOB|nr:glycoside hydrolase/phage tail family protein [Marivivens donghaensis]NIY72675.1 host specificity protein [Marivivens donghaensis]